MFGSGKTDIHGSLSVLGIIFGYFLSHLVSCINHLTLHCSAGQLVQQQHAGNEKDKIIMQIIPTIIPITAVVASSTFKASGIKLKQTTANINPDANDSTKLKNLFEFFLHIIPIIPPNVVPIVPKNKPINVVRSILKISLLFLNNIL